MGIVTSLLSGEQEEIHEVVLVPPLFERDHKGRSRLAKSSYDFLFIKPNLRWLFNDYIPVGAVKSILYFSPPEDPRISVTARFKASVDRGNKYVQLGDCKHGSANLRFQETPINPSNFFDVRVSTQEDSGVRLRGCYYDAARGLGIFGTLKPALSDDENDIPDASIGLRYSTTALSAGVAVNPFAESCRQIWLVNLRLPVKAFVSQMTLLAHEVARDGPLTAGLQLRDPEFSGVLKRQGHQLWREVQSRLSYAVAYSPAGPAIGRGHFTAALEVVESQRLVMSFLHHMALQRRCRNPFEDSQVAGITNYLDIGLQVATSLKKRQKGEADFVANSLRLGASCQVNKNLLLKARMGTDAAVASVAFKAWWQPSFTLGVSAGYDLQKRKPVFGFVCNCENYGNIRYERGQRVAYGGALVQRHVALPQDLANKEGKGLLVRQEDLDKETPYQSHILGQTTNQNSFVL